MEESESRFREQIYNWFKNTIGRTRRKLEGRPRSSKKASEKAVSSAPNTDLTWSANVSPPPIIPYPSVEVDSPVAITTTQTAIITPTQYGSSLQPDNNISSSIPPTASPHHAISISFDKPTLREGFLHGVDPPTLASMIQNFTISNPSPTPLAGVVDALFEAVSADSNNSFSRDPHVYLRRFYDASTYFSPSIVHAGVSGPLAGPRALQMQIRKYSTWNPNTSSSPARRHSTQSSSVTTSITDEMQRIASDRQRRRDHIQWARIHAAALELGMLGMGNIRDADNNGYAYATGRMLSEMMARDAVWETDEVEWVAGICILRALIRTAIRGDRRQRDDYDELLRTYEGRWKEIKDETRQALVTVKVSFYLVLDRS
ncbi:hypothetical protein BD779DRAFT_1520044 [Infundibulicybe gibba]|nr:hypothetical protein BD779DRAFT_1520044 [Infundibulicybe gibba]